MNRKKTVVCKCEKCGNEAEMTIKCEEVVRAGPSDQPPREKLKRTVVCTRCGNEADLTVEYVD